MSFFKRGPKYGNKKVFNEEAGRNLASGGENNCFKYLRLLEKAGEIANLRTQAHVYLTDARVHMIPDFQYFNVKDNREEWAEFKGFETDVYRIKRRLWTVYGPGPLKVYKEVRGGMVLKETIIPSREKKLLLSGSAPQETCDKCPFNENPL